MRILPGTLLLLVISCGGPTEEKAPPVLGAPCDHGGDVEFEGQRMTRDEAACGGEVCAFVAPLPSSYDDCDGTADCERYTVNYPGAEACEANACRVTDAYRLSRSMCAPECSSSADCEGAAAGDTACASGFVCARFLASCCERHCFCADDALPGIVESGELACANGEMPTELFPGCMLGAQ